jgi:hypothetical protein
MPQLSQIVSSPVGSFAVLALAAYLEVQGDAFFQSDLRRSFGTKRLVGLSREPVVLASWLPRSWRKCNFISR